MRKLLLPVAALLVAGLAVGLWAFQPWRAFTSSTVDEAAPTSAEPPASGSATPRPRPHGGSGSATPEEPRDEVLSRAPFEDAEHATSGRAAILQLADGRRFVRLEDLVSDDGPDLHVWLSDAPSGGDWGSYDDGRSVALGELKATSGNQNYEIPDDVDLRGLRSVVIWCDRFNVAFGSAPIRG